MAIEGYSLMIDPTYEFSAPGFFDFIDGETEDEMKRAELWFDSALSYAPSPFMPRIKSGRSVAIETLCDFGDTENLKKDGGLSGSTNASCLTEDASLVPQAENSTSVDAELRKTELKKEEDATNHHEQETNTNVIALAKKPDEDEDVACAQVRESVSSATASAVVVTGKATTESEGSSAADMNQGTELCTPKPQMLPKRGDPRLTGPRANQTAKKIASLVKNPSALKLRNQSQLSQMKCGKPTPVRSATTAKKPDKASDNFIQENQAIKRQKLEGGRTRQILNPKTKNLPHKSRPGVPANSCLSGSKTRKEDRKLYVREQAQAQPYVSLAEMVNRFQSSTRNTSLPQKNCSLSHDDAASVNHRKPKLTLTRPKGPDFETSQRARPVRLKSSAEIEEEMMAKIPKFKARPVNKKILEGPTLPALPRSKPHLPEFKEFHLKTMERAHQHDDDTSTVVSATESSHQNQWDPHKLIEPKMPRLETLLRARPPKVKSTEELEKEELEKIPKFKARPLNKKIFESKGDLGIYCNAKRQVTVPQEFSFATDERIPPARAVADLFDKSTEELEKEELEKIPKFKARPLNKKIFESKGDLGIYCNAKRQVTVPQEFSFATDERIPPARAVADLFDKLSLNSEPRHNHQLLRLTRPNPFHLQTEERGAEKERKLMEEIQHKQIQEERARIPNATPYPYTTDYPVIPPKPEPKHCTKPEPFQLESLVRHEEELQREMEERERLEREEFQMRIFKAQPVLKEDPLPVPEKARRPLTQVEEFELHVDHRAVDRAEFDKKIKEKEMICKRYREECESARMMEEEKAVKQMRRTMVPHAIPLPKFDNPFHPRRSSKETTKAKSPKLRVLQRTARRTMATANAQCAAASQMR